MSLVQYAARFENLRDAFDDTQAEIRANIYPGMFSMTLSIMALSITVASIIKCSTFHY